MQTILAVAAVSMLAVPMTQAQSRNDPPPRQGQQIQQQSQRPAPGRQQFRQGQRITNWRQLQRIPSHRQYGLPAPGRGEQWVRVNNQFLLISAATGAIVAITTGR